MTAKRIILGEVLKYRNGFFIRTRYESSRRRLKLSCSDTADNHDVELTVAGGFEAIVIHNRRARTELHFSSLRVLGPGELIMED